MSPAGIYRGALDLPLPPAAAPLHPRSTGPNRRSARRGVKGIFVLPRAIPWKFCVEISRRRHLWSHLLCPLWNSWAMLRFFLQTQKLSGLSRSHRGDFGGCSWPQRGSEQSKDTGSGAGGKEWECENASGHHEEWGWGVGHEAAGLGAVIRRWFRPLNASFASPASKDV